MTGKLVLASVAALAAVALTAIQVAPITKARQFREPPSRGDLGPQATGDGQKLPVFETFSGGPMSFTYRSASGDLATSSRAWKNVANMSFPIKIPKVGPVLITFCAETAIDGQQVVWFRAQLGQLLGEPFAVAALWSGFSAQLGSQCFTWGIAEAQAKKYRLKIQWTIDDPSKEALMDQRSVTVWYPTADDTAS